MTRRHFLRVTGQTVLVLTLAACAGVALITHQAADELAPAVADSTLRFHTRSTPQENALYERQMARFSEQHPDLTLQQEALGEADFAELLLARQASGEIGDVLWSSTSQDRLLRAWRQQLIQPLDELVAAAGLDRGQWYPNCLASIQLDQQLLGLPFKAHPGSALVYYNQHLLTQARAAPPQPGWNQQQQIELAQQLTRPNHEPGGYLPALDNLWQTLTTLLPAFGGELLSPTGATLQLASAPGQAALRYLYDLFHTYRVAPLPSPTRDSGSDLWVSGNLAMLQSATRLAALAVVVDEHFPWMVVPNALGPAGVGGASCVVDVQCVTRATQQPQAALAWVEFLCNQASGLELGRLGGTCGARPDVYEAPELLQFPYRRVFQAVMAEAAPARMTANGQQAAAEHQLEQLLAPLWLGLQSPTAEFIETVAAQVQQLLDEPLTAT